MMTVQKQQKLTPAILTLVEASVNEQYVQIESSDPLIAGIYKPLNLSGVDAEGWPIFLGVQPNETMPVATSSRYFKSVKIVPQPNIYRTDAEDLNLRTYPEGTILVLTKHETQVPPVPHIIDGNKAIVARVISVQGSGGVKAFALEAIYPPSVDLSRLGYSTVSEGFTHKRLNLLGYDAFVADKEGLAERKSTDAEKSLYVLRDRVFDTIMDRLAGEGTPAGTVSQQDKEIEIRHDDGSTTLVTFSTLDAEE